MSDFDMSEFPTLFAGRWTTTGLADAISGIDRDELIKEYREAMQRAPSRADRDKSYFVDSHTGHLSGADSSNLRSIWRSRSGISEETGRGRMVGEPVCWITSSP